MLSGKFVIDLEGETIKDLLLEVINTVPPIEHDLLLGEDSKERSKLSASFSKNVMIHLKTTNEESIKATIRRIRRHYQK